MISEIPLVVVADTVTVSVVVKVDKGLSIENVTAPGTSDKEVGSITYVVTVES